MKSTAVIIAFVATAGGYALQRAQSDPVPTAKIFEALQLRDGSTVCEIGAGSGELTIEAAKLVGPSGRVYTSELGNDRVKSLQKKVSESGLTQITVVEGDLNRTKFPESACDALFMRNVYHHFEDPASMDASILASVKPGGRVVVVDFTPPGKEAESPADRDKDGMHGIKPETLSNELKSAGFEAVSSETGAQRWFMVVVAKPKGGGG